MSCSPWLGEGVQPNKVFAQVVPRRSLTLHADKRRSCLCLVLIRRTSALCTASFSESKLIHCHAMLHSCSDHFAYPSTVFGTVHSSVPNAILHVGDGALVKSLLLDLAPGSSASVASLWAPDDPLSCDFLGPIFSIYLESYLQVRASLFCRCSLAFSLNADYNLHYRYRIK